MVGRRLGNLVAIRFGRRPEGRRGRDWMRITSFHPRRRRVEEEGQRRAHGCSLGVAVRKRGEETGKGAAQRKEARAVRLQHPFQPWTAERMRERYAEERCAGRGEGERGGEGCSVRKR